jgi:hypothetical protein
MVDKPTFSRKAWIDTINEISVQYSKIKREIYEGAFYPYAIQTDGAHLFLAGYASVGGSTYLRLEKRACRRFAQGRRHAHECARNLDGHRAE